MRVTRADSPPRGAAPRVCRTRCRFDEWAGATPYRRRRYGIGRSAAPRRRIAWSPGACLTGRERAALAVACAAPARDRVGIAGDLRPSDLLDAPVRRHTGRSHDVARGCRTTHCLRRTIQWTYQNELPIWQRGARRTFQMGIVALYAGTAVVLIPDDDDTPTGGLAIAAAGVVALVELAWCGTTLIVTSGRATARRLRGRRSIRPIVKLLRVEPVWIAAEPENFREQPDGATQCAGTEPSSASEVSTE